MIVKIINNSRNLLPEYKTSLAAGMDIYADLDDEIELNMLERILIPTGLFIEIPAGFEAQVRPRSGLALKSGLTVLNSPGTIDADYRGEIKILLINLSKETAKIQPGDRIAQLIFAKHEQIKWELAVQLSNTDRGEGGYGHTGK